MNDFIARLKQRKLVQWAVAYGAFAFALLQGIDVVAQQFEWPAMLQRGVTMALVVGFFVALLLAWYHGERGAQTVSGPELVLLALVLAVGGGLMWRIAGGSPAAPSAHDVAADKAGMAGSAEEADPKSIAVLPFASMSAGQDEAYFADGLSEETINALSRVPDLRVAARTSSFAFRNSEKTIPAIARELQVATVLEGSVRRSGDHLRMTAQLIRASDGFELWSETYDRTNSDVISIQEDVARSIAQALKTAADPEALAGMQRSGTRSVPAYQAYLRGLALEQRASRDSEYALNDDALDAYNQATRIDPRFADAYARAADLEMDLLRPSAMGSQEARTSDYAERLRRLHDDLDRASANARNTAERLYYDALRASSNQQFIEALGLMRQYARAYPKLASPYYYIGQWELYRGDYVAAHAAAEALERLQTDELVNDTAVTLLVWSGDGKRAALSARRKLEAHPDAAGTIYQAQRAFLTAGETREAAKLMPRLLASRLPPLSKVLVQVRQACAEGRTGDARRLYESMAGIGDPGTSERWHVLQLLGRPAEASRLFAYMDTPMYFNGLSSFLVYPYFDVSRYPNLEKVLLDQGIRRPPPRREPYACTPGGAAH